MSSKNISINKIITKVVEHMLDMDSLKRGKGMIHNYQVIIRDRIAASLLMNEYFEQTNGSRISLCILL